jgi:hypothetical protein
MSKFQILVTNPAGADLGDLGLDAEGVQFSTRSNGGCDMLTFKLPQRYDLVPLWAGLNYRVNVKDSRSLFWSGRMEDFKAQSTPSGEYWNITAYGYGVNGDDQAYASQDVSNTETSVIISDAITALAPQIGATSITASGYTLSAATAITLKSLKAAAVWNWAARIGNSAQADMIWEVYPDADGTIRFTLKVRPTTVGYFLRASEFRGKDFGFVGRNVCNRVVVRYNAGANFVTREDTALQTLWGLIRSKEITYDELTQAVDANQLGDTVLAKYKVLRMSANKLEAVDPFIIDANGQQEDPWRVRAGMLYQFEDVSPYQAAQTSLTFSNSFLGVATNYDEDRQTLTLTPESFEQEVTAATSHATQLLAGRHTV